MTNTIQTQEVAGMEEQRIVIGQREEAAEERRLTEIRGSAAAIASAVADSPLLLHADDKDMFSQSVITQYNNIEEPSSVIQTVQNQPQQS